jgi:hypothetical protein
MSRYYRSFLEESTVPYTTRTTAFATATGITDTTILGALNTFDLGLISNGLDIKMKAVYPFLGGTASTHKYNFIDARDLDIAFRLTFNGGWTHSSTGALPNGTNGYADTKLIPSSILTFANTHFSLYSRTNSITDAWSIGASNNYLPIWSMSLKTTDSSVFFDGYDYGSHRISVGNIDSKGHYIGNISSSTSQKIIKNGTIIQSTSVSQSQSTLPSYSVYISGRNDSGTTTTFDNRELAFATIGSGLTDAEASTLYTLTQAMQTTLGRQV